MNVLTIVCCHHGQLQHTPCQYSLRWYKHSFKGYFKPKPSVVSQAYLKGDSQQWILTSQNRHVLLLFKDDFVFFLISCLLHIFHSRKFFINHFNISEINICVLDFLILSRMSYVEILLWMCILIERTSKPNHQCKCVWCF